jgi:hypothetical protein
MTVFVLFASCALAAPLVMADANTFVGTDRNEECEKQVPHVSNEVVFSIPEVNLDEQTQTTEDLAVIAGVHNGEHMQIGGVTSARFLFNSEIRPNMVTLGPGMGVCARPAMKITIGYTSISVYMDWEIQHSSCIYNAIFTHEMHHVSIYKNYLTSHQGQIKAELDQRLGSQTHYFKTENEAQQYVQTLADDFSQYWRRKFISEVDAEQSGLDTQAEYTRVQRQCRH